jgi:hypothetical protein
MKCVTAWQLLMAEVESIPMPSTSRERFYAFFRASAGDQLYFPKKRLVASDIDREVRHFQECGMDRSLMRDRLMAKYGVSRVTAYRSIARALKLPA